MEALGPTLAISVMSSDGLCLMKLFCQLHTASSLPYTLYHLPYTSHPPSPSPPPSPVVIEKQGPKIKKYSHECGDT